MMRWRLTILGLMGLLGLVWMTAQAQGGSAQLYMPMVSAPTSAETPPPPPPSEFPPSDFDDLLTQNVANGTWTYGEGVARILSYFAEEIPLNQLPGASQLEGHHATSFFESAVAYRDSLTNSAEIVELDRLLAISLPDLTHIDLYVTESDQPTAASDTDCKTLWRRGFNDNNPSNKKCFRHAIVKYKGTTVNIYTATYFADPKETQDRIADAVSKSLLAYTQYGQMPAEITLITSPLLETGTVVGAAFGERGQPDRCPVVLYAPLFRDGYDVVGQDKQVIAHELFHCFQFKNLNNQMYFSNNRARNWWSEGSAEYFSNVVFPSADLEYEANETNFRNRSLTQSLLDLKYENFLFFQYLGNRLGNQGVVDMLRKMPTSGGRAEQQKALSAVVNDELFHAFATAYLDANIKDSSGSIIMKDPSSRVIRTVALSKSQDVAFTHQVKPFSLPRFELAYPGGVYFNQTFTTPSGAPVVSVQDASGGGWQSVPPFVSACGVKKTQILVATSAAPTSAETHSFSLTVPKGKEERCTCFIEFTLDNVPYFHSIVVYDSGLPPQNATEILANDMAQFSLTFQTQNIPDGWKGILPLQELYFQNLVDHSVGTVLPNEGGSGEVTILLNENQVLEGAIFADVVHHDFFTNQQRVVQMTGVFRAVPNFQKALCQG